MDPVVPEGFYDWLIVQRDRSDTVGWVVRLLREHEDESPLLPGIREAGDIDALFELISSLERGKIKNSLLAAYEEYYNVGI